MSRRSLYRNPGAGRGFTLIEALVSITILIIVMTAAVSLLFAMRSFAEKQQNFTAPRQSARSAMDYVAYWVQGAGDMNINRVPNSPSAMIMYYLGDAAAGSPLRRAAYNNLTGSETGNSITVPGQSTQFGDLGTDLITLAFPTNPVKLLVASPTTLCLPLAAISFNYSFGCGGAANNNPANLAAFRRDAGYTAAAGPAPLSTLVDSQGNYCYVTLQANPTSDCTMAGPPGQAFNYPVIATVANAAGAGQIDPNGGHLVPPQCMVAPVYLHAGINYVSFRVLNSTLQQKNGMFDPANPGNGFFPIMENVEDFQVAYIYGLGTQAGQVYNTATQQIPVATNPDRVPTQAGIGVVGAYDITNVVGVRLTITARSLPLRLSGLKLTSLTATSPSDPTVYYHYRPAAEDHPQGALDYSSASAPVYQHYRLTTTLMLRNRTLGG